MLTLMPVSAGVGLYEVQHSVNPEWRGSDAIPGFFPPCAGRMVLRDDTASTELRFATPRGPQDGPQGEEAVAQPATVLFGMLNAPP